MKVYKVEVLIINFDDNPLNTSDPEITKREYIKLFGGK
jgi:hypothetical protein